MGHIPNQHLDPLPILPRLFKKTHNLIGKDF